MKLLSAVIAALIAATALPAAGAWRYPGDFRIELQANEKGSGGPRRAPQRDSRESDRAPQREHRSEGRLTDEERRALRRDVDRASREIYKGARR